MFLWLGCLGFGGPVAHLALMEEAVVRRRRWVSAEEFLDLVGLTNLIPGPNSTEMVMALGHRRAGWAGLLLGGASFILPAATITALLAWSYVRYGSLPDVAPWLTGLGPAVVGLMAGAVIRLARPAFGTGVQLTVGVGVTVLALAGVDEVVLLLLGGAAGMLLGRVARPGVLVLCGLVTMAVAAGAEPLARPAAADPSLGAVGLFFLRTGAVLYGGGYVLVALLQPLVDAHGWLTQAELVDAVAAGQITPGPVLTTATFVGYLVRGAGGAVVATLAIFLPAFLLVGLLGSIAPRLRRWPATRGFLAGVNAASVALMIAVTIILGRSAIAGPASVLILALSFAAAARGVNGGWIVLGGLIAGGLMRAAGF